MAYPSHKNDTSAESVIDPSVHSMENKMGSARGHAKSLGAIQDISPNFPPPKTDKPRPHVCTICTRGFARLEHLKRHERSHTKEKPFACNECTRCFARRDLLLRHQQKLHMSVPPSTRRRRESAGSTAGASSTRVRKNSVTSNASGSTVASMRPRANTISHVDNTMICPPGTMTSSAFPTGPEMAFAHQGIDGLPGVGNHHYRGMSSAHGQHGNPHVLPKLETKNRPMDMSGSLRTAPPHGGFGADGGIDGILFGGSTVNPAQLHFSNSPNAFGFDSPLSPYQQGFSGFPPAHGSADGEAWLNTFDQYMSFNDEQAIENSSPSAIDSASPTAVSEMMVEANTPSNAEWQSSFMSQAPFASFSRNSSSHHLSDFYTTGPLSPKSNGFPMDPAEPFFDAPPPVPSNVPHPILRSQPFFPADLSANSDTPTNSNASTSSSNRQSSVTSVSTDTITDLTRQALLNSLTDCQPSGTNLPKAHHPNASSPTSTGPLHGRTLPSTHDLQRYVGAYLKYFHPHLPFLHVPTLQFDAPAFTSALSSADPILGENHLIGGGGSLILSMAAIGALYEYDNTASNDLFEMAKSMIQIYLQEHRRVEMSKGNMINANGTEMNSNNTPLWLVQAMLLNVIYGHNSGDRTAAGIANTHCAALVSLARGANLVQPSGHSQSMHTFQPSNDVNLGLSADGQPARPGFSTFASLDVDREWHAWKSAEERKRTLYAIFILSSLLVSAYNSSPALMNSEILLDLPSDEKLWSAESAETWRSLGGSMSAQQPETSFADALTSLLNASQRKAKVQRRSSRPFESVGANLESLPEVELRPSTFGCLILINALHNYIWETRQRHIGRKWSQHDTDLMHAHLEPALRAWQTAWSSNSDHSLERPNPFGATSLSADCIPLLDLAYVRLFVNLDRSKELFFQRNWTAMAEEFANSPGIVQHSEHCSSHGPQTTVSGLDTSDQMTPESDCSIKCSKREQHLRQAAFCAANSLMMSDRLNVTFADFNSKELPLQSALCAFDCSQILAEWISTLQQRVGQYLGILGKDAVHFNDNSASMWLEEDDIKLLEKVKEILGNAEMKLSRSVDRKAMVSPAASDAPELEDCGYGSKLLSLHARMFEREAVWPLCREMSQALRTQAWHIKTKIDQSLHTPA